MKFNLKKMQTGVLKLIFWLLWFAAILFVAGFLGNILGISVMNDEIWMIFGTILSFLVVLGFLNVVISLNIISNSVSVNSKYEEYNNEEIKYKKIFQISVIIIILILGTQTILKLQVEKRKFDILKKQSQDIRNSTIMEDILIQIDKDTQMKELYFSRDLLLLSMRENSMYLLIPKTKGKDKVFYKITAWDYNSEDERKISEALSKPYIPDEKEKEKFHKMLEDKKSFSVKEHSNISIFYPIEKNNEIKLILVINSRTDINPDVLRERSALAKASN